MAAITSLGIGSGADLNSLLTQLVAVERQPLQVMKQAASGLQSQVSSYGRLSSLLSTLQTAATTLSGGALWAQTRSASSDPTAVGVSGDGGAAAGSFSVSVARLAAAQTLASATALPDSAATVGAGRLTIDTGRWNDQLPMNFVPHVGREPVSVMVGADDTLATLRDKINAADAGVTASLVSDASGVRLALRSTATGADQGFRVQAGNDDGSPADAGGLARFGYDPAAGTGSMQLRSAAANAQAEVDGIAVESASNELSGVVEGVTLTLRKAGAAAQVDVGRDTDAVQGAVKGFVDAYNALVSTIAEQTRFDATSRTAGPLQGDSAVGTLQRQLRGALNSVSGASSTFARLSDIGLQAQRDGTLAIDSGKLAAAMTKLPELQKAFAAIDRVDGANQGFARRYADLATNLLGVDGVLTARTQGLQRLIARNGEQQTRLNDRVDRFQQRMVAQYTALDSNLARMNALSTSLTQQLDQLTKTSRN